LWQIGILTLSVTLFKVGVDSSINLYTATNESLEHYYDANAISVCQKLYKM